MTTNKPLGKTLAASILGLIATVSTVNAGTISDFNDSWAGRAAALQRLVDVHAPMSDNNILGTHNTYNSEAYTACNLSVGCRYLDPQQKYNIKNQLKIGARFIEIDVHWTTKMESLFSYPKRLLMCHGVCSINDKYFTEGLDEVKSWLDSSNSDNQVIILMVEDHMDGNHQQAFDQINSRIGNWIYRSGGCGSIPRSATKADILQAGKKVLLWGSGGCRSNSDWKNTAYTGLGRIGRVWEDRTTLGTIANVIEGGSTDYINSSDVREFFKQGANIVNLDDMVTDDGRLKASIWSWATNQPNDLGNGQDCGSMRYDGRWNDDYCSTYFHHACKGESNGDWALSADVGNWSQGQSACQALGNQYHFAVPTNSKDNAVLSEVRDNANIERIWLNLDDRTTEGVWYIEGQSPLF
ncbi:MAG: phosphatidylinositol-specific phospholipase C domain-containing protein [Algicola sp.]|nr:phosphatidylinositol-specific phospholipase C domain-containing protein [Algicola sp.]